MSSRDRPEHRVNRTGTVSYYRLDAYIGRSEWNGRPFLEANYCDWCERQLDGVGKSLQVNFDPDGHWFETELLCEPCDRYGPPGGSRRQRVEAAWTIEPQMSRLEKLGWALIHRARR